LLEFVVTSQAAYSHLTEVSCLEFTTKHHSLSFSGLSQSTTSTFGIVPTATKIQSALRVFPDFKVAQVIHITSQVISSTSSFNTNSIFSFSLALSIQESSALNVSLL
jgi:hypothetical protein